MRKSILFILISLLLAGSGYSQRIKFATVAPEGSTYLKVLREYADEVTELTGGKQLTESTLPTTEQPTENAIETATPPATENNAGEQPAEFASENDLSNANTHSANPVTAKKKSFGSTNENRTPAPLTHTETDKDNNPNTPDPKPATEIQLAGIEGSPQKVQLEEAPVQQPDPTLQEIIAREDAQEKDGTVEEQEDVETRKPHHNR